MESFWQVFFWQGEYVSVFGIAQLERMNENEAIFEEEGKGNNTYERTRVRRIKPVITTPRGQCHV